MREMLMRMTGTTLRPVSTINLYQSCLFPLLINYLVVVNIKARVEAVKQRLAIHSKRSSGIHSIPSSPVPTYSPLYVNTPPK